MQCCDRRNQLVDIPALECESVCTCMSVFICTSMYAYMHMYNVRIYIYMYIYNVYRNCSARVGMMINIS